MPVQAIPCNGNSPVRTRGGYIAGDVRLEALIQDKQNLGFVGLDEYLDPSGLGGTIPENKLNLLTSYLLNKVSVYNHVYYLSGQTEDALFFTCPDLDVEENQVELNLHNRAFIFHSAAGDRDHDHLHNLEYHVSGHIGFAGIEFGTTAHWNSMPEYIPVEGMIVVYTDYATDEESGKLIPNFKIGDGNAHLIDKPFIGADIREALTEHIEDSGIHVSPEDRQFWDNKLNYNDPVGDLLEFTRN